jgi:hypothetical protein
LRLSTQACGISILALGVWATSGRIGGIFGAYPGIGLITAAAILIFTVLLGEYSARVDNKCLLLIVSLQATAVWLSWRRVDAACVSEVIALPCLRFLLCSGLYLQYFLVIFAGFVTFVASGIAVLSDGPGGDTNVVAGWCSFPESAARAQEAFQCCGLACPSDLPAQASCPGGQAYNGTAPQCKVGNNDAAVCALPVASRPVNSSLPGCQNLAVTYVNERIVPLFSAALVIGFLLLAAMLVSCKLLCKRNGRRAQGDNGGKAMYEAVSLNSAQGATDGWIDTSTAADSGAGVAASGPMSLDMPGAAGASGPEPVRPSSASDVAVSPSRA